MDHDRAPASPGRPQRGLAAVAVLALLCAVVVTVWALLQPGSPVDPGGVVASTATTTGPAVAPGSSAGSPGASGGSASSRSAASAASSASAGPLRVVGLGDSVEAGTACSNCTAFVDLTAQRIGAQQHRTPHVDTVAANGWTTTDIRAQLSTATVRAAVAASDLVVVEIGANDLDESQAASSSCASNPVASCYASALAAVRQNLRTILATVRGLQTRAGAQVVVLGYWNVFADGQVAALQGSTYVTTATTVTREFDLEVEQVAEATGVLFADAWTPFRGVDGTDDDTEYLASDGEHPNQAGHRLLAQAVIDALGPRATTL